MTKLKIIFCIYILSTAALCTADTPLREIKIPVTCTYEVHPWAENVLFPILKEFNAILTKMKKLVDRTSHRRAINLYSQYANQIESNIKKLQAVTPMRTDFMNSPAAKEEIAGIINTMEEIVKNLRSIKRTVGQFDITQLNIFIKNYHEEYKKIEVGIEFLKLNKVDSMDASVVIPPKFKGWVDVRPFCNKKLTPGQQVTIKGDLTTYKRKQASH
ncbi:MAG TPA: hypothetical protein QGF02_03105 [Candidatus Babeliales bacterium]|nr:hypothetical protein [Candidatus Babeliales bacterium]